MELIITMSLIAILSSFGMNSYLNSQKRARDAQRQSDLYQYKVALENYASVNGDVYPVASGVANTVLAVPLANYMTGFPADPKTTTYRYASDGTLYVLDACMEVSSTLFETCSIGKSGATALACTATRNTSCDL